MRNRSVYIDESGEKPLHPIIKLTLSAMKTILVVILVIGFALLGLGGGAAYAFLSDVELLDSDSLIIQSGLTSYIYDSKGNISASLTGSDNLNREVVQYSQIPLDLVHALVSIEDERFYQHNGVDTRRTLSAILSYITGFGNKHGGSTITQQLIKVVTGNDVQSPQRKVQEWWMAMSLENEMEKWQIMNEYLNRIYTGNGCYGVQSAAKTYFSKNVWELSLAECALIAGLTNEPSTYNPFTKDGRIAAKERQELILAQMLNQGWIFEDEYKAAIREELVYSKPEEIKTSAAIYTYFVDHVINEVIEGLAKEYGITKEVAELRLYNNGYRVYTTQDPDIQAAMDEQFLNEDNFFKDNRIAKQYDETPQAGMVILDPNTSAILALYGGAGEKTGSRYFNRATQLDRHPGSSLKPLAVYGPGIDSGAITAATVVDDIPVRMYTIYDGEDRMKELYPVNFETGQYFGLTNVRTALQKSRNVCAALIFRDILTPPKSVEYLKKVNLDRSNEQYISLALGGPEDGMSPLEMAGAYVPLR